MILKPGEVAYHNQPDQTPQQGNPQKQKEELSKIPLKELQDNRGIGPEHDEQENIEDAESRPKQYLFGLVGNLLDIPSLS